MGRLFDAVACLTGIRNEVTYEAQAAIELEVLSTSALMAASPYGYEIDGENIYVGEILKHVIEDVRRKVSAGFIGARFHQTLAALTLDICQHLRNKYDIHEIVLSGGVWQNQLLLDLARSALIQKDFMVYTHRLTPANDGGLALGQAAVAAFKMKR